MQPNSILKNVQLDLWTWSKTSHQLLQAFRRMLQHCLASRTVLRMEKLSTGRRVSFKSGIKNCECWNFGQLWLFGQFNHSTNLTNKNENLKPVIILTFLHQNCSRNIHQITTNYFCGQFAIYCPGVTRGSDHLLSLNCKPVKVLTLTAVASALGFFSYLSSFNQRVGR